MLIDYRITVTFTIKVLVIVEKSVLDMHACVQGSRGSPVGEALRLILYCLIVTTTGRITPYL
jgi:hypothetical protein